MSVDKPTGMSFMFFLVRYVVILVFCWNQNFQLGFHFCTVQKKWDLSNIYLLIHSCDATTDFPRPQVISKAQGCLENLQIGATGGFHEVLNGNTEATIWGNVMNKKRYPPQKGDGTKMVDVFFFASPPGRLYLRFGLIKVIVC